MLKPLLEIAARILAWLDPKKRHKARALRYLREEAARKAREERGLADPAWLRLAATLAVALLLLLSLQGCAGRAVPDDVAALQAEVEDLRSRLERCEESASRCADLLEECESLLE